MKLYLECKRIKFCHLNTLIKPPEKNRQNKHVHDMLFIWTDHIYN